MLILSRKPGEEIIITVAGIEIRLVVAGLVHHGSRRAVLGFEAPDEVKIFRRELLPPDSV